MTHLLILWTLEVCGSWCLGVVRTITDDWHVPILYRLGLKKVMDDKLRVKKDSLVAMKCVRVNDTYVLWGKTILEGSAITTNSNVSGFT